MKLIIQQILLVSCVFTHTVFAQSETGVVDVGTARVGQTVTFRAISDGYPAPTFQWFRNGMLIPGATSNVLEMVNVTQVNTGVYMVEATNEVGSARSNQLGLRVIALPKKAIDSYEVLAVWDALRKDFASANVSVQAIKFARI